jgi:hypothetical protein
MSISSLRSTIDSLRRAIADLQKNDASESSREAEYYRRANAALSSAQRSTSASSRTSYLRDHERALSDMAGIQKKRADLAGKIADKGKDLTRQLENLSREEERERAKLADQSKRDQREREAKDKKAADDLRKFGEEQRRLQSEREAHERRVTAELRHRTSIAPVPENMISAEADVEYDFFISHAHEDKADFVTGLADALKALGAKVWYDDFTLRVGDSLRRSIDKGLAKSRFGVVVLSEAFFKKEWPQRELDGLYARETGGQRLILPIWHKVSKDEVAAYSPTIADRVALSTSTKTVNEIAGELHSLL